MVKARHLSSDQPQNAPRGPPQDVRGSAQQARLGLSPNSLGAPFRHEGPDDTLHAQAQLLGRAHKALDDATTPSSLPGGMMTSVDLVTLVIAYDNLDTAIGDYDDLARAQHEGRVGRFHAAVVQRTEAGLETSRTTVEPQEKLTLRLAGLGAVIGVLITPAAAAALLGGGLGAVIGDLGDRIDAFKHADMAEVERLVGDHPASMIVVAASETIAHVVEAAAARDREIALPFTQADVGLLKAELQRVEASPNVVP